MFALIVVANPNPDSFSHAMAAVARRTLAQHHCDVALHDLHAERYDPVQPTGEATNTASSDALVEQHCAELARADLIVVCHSVWWGQPPAILKGLIDRTFRLDTAYGYPEGVGPEGIPVGLLRARQALVFNTSNTPAEREREALGDPLERIWKDCIFDLCGVRHFTRRTCAPIASSSLAQREAWLAEVEALVRAAV